MKFDLLRDLLFLLPTETSHHLSLQSISLLESVRLSPFIAKPRVEDPVELMGIRFPNRVGLAAGLDKDARYIDGLDALGFGFVEVGTVTPLAQPGNAKPRLFRLAPEQAIINRMGFNNDGVDALVRSVRRRRSEGVLGINIGKNKLTPSEHAVSDYVACLKKVYKHADYVTVNISSPNTQDLRALQHGDELAQLLEGLKECHRELVEKNDKHVPLLVKIAPDMEEVELKEICQRLLAFEIDGVIVSNTTTARQGVEKSRHGSEAGGLSGAPVRDLSNLALQAVASELKSKMTIVGVGGILDGEDAAQKIQLGADLVQLYTGFIFKGPDLIESSAKAISVLKNH